MPDSTPLNAAEDAIARHTCANAGELLDFFNARDPRWHPTPENWVFRGQSEDWPLRAKAHRDGPWFEQLGAPFTHAKDPDPKLRLDDFRLEQLLDHFCYQIDRAGRSIPAPSPKVTGSRNSE